MSTAGPAHRVQSAVVEYGYPQGHLGHLSPEEETAFANFKVICEEKGIYEPANGDTPASHDDATLLRFLRARRFVAGDALKQFQDTEEWRKTNEINQLYETIDLDQYEECRRLYPQWTGRRDRRGIPVYVYEVKHLNSKTMAAYEKSAKETSSKAKTDGNIPPKLLRLFALYENLTRFVMPLCSALADREHPRTPITQSNNIVDISGVGLKQFWNLRGHMQDASTLATAHYPETLDRIFIIGAPAFFPTVWSWIKRWFDPITTSKIFILSHDDMKKTLEGFIEPRNIPRKYGGELDFKFGDMPVLDPHLASVLKWEGDRNDFPHGPMYWVDKTKDGKEIEVIAVGSTDGQERREGVGILTKALEDDEDLKGSNGYADAITEKARYGDHLRPELLRAPTEVDEPAQLEKTNGEAKQNLPVAVQEGELVPATCPEPVKFHTAVEGVESLTLNEKTNNFTNGSANGNGPHSTRAANLLDPAVKLDVVPNRLPVESGYINHKADDVVAGGVEGADSAHKQAITL